MANRKINYGSFYEKVLFINPNYKKKCDRTIFKNPGIYKITNVITGECYIGQSTNVNRRLHDHKRLLRNNKHKYKRGSLSLLQIAWNTYGENNFKFEVIELCDKQDLNKREIYWIKHYQCNFQKYRKGYNYTDGGEGSNGCQFLKGRIHINNGVVEKVISTEDLSLYEGLGYSKGILQSTKDKMRRNRKIVTGEQHWNYKKPVSKETREKLSKSHKGKPIIKLQGRKFTKEHVENLKRGKYKPVVQLTEDNIYVAEYDSLKQAEEVTGISSGHISECCNNKREKYRGFKWRFKENESVENI